MFKIKTAIFALVTLVVTAISWTPPTEVCHKINAKGKGYTVSMTESGVTTAASIIGGGVLHGTTSADFVFTGMSGTEVSFVGTLVLTTKHGTVTYEVSNGVFDVATLGFVANLYVTDGNGRFEGASGTLQLSGFNNPDGTFTEDVTGVICLKK